MRLEIRAFVGALLLMAPCGCLFDGTSEPARYFIPVTAPGPEGDSSVSRPLKLQRVQSTGHLKERIVWRSDQAESGFYELKRWTELPAEYVEREIAFELFERRKLQRSDSGRTPRLQLSLHAFDEVIADPAKARVEVRATLFDMEYVALFEETVVSEVPVDEGGLARAMGRALDDVVDRIASRVVTSLEQTMSGRDDDDA